MRKLTIGIAVSAATMLVQAGDYNVPDSVIDQQNANLIANTEGKGYPPQSPRDIDKTKGNNERIFSEAPSADQMNLCNIHFHKSAEHKGGEFTTYVGNGDGFGYGTGYAYDGTFTQQELVPVANVCLGSHGALQSGDTIETHYVHTTALATPAPTLGACLSDADINPQLRVETIVMALVNDPNAADFGQVSKVVKRGGYYQVPNIPEDLGAPVQYEGSTTGPSYNEKGSPIQVSWSVRPKVLKVDINSVGDWCNDNVFDEYEAHGVRNLVKAKELLSHID